VPRFVAYNIPYSHKLLRYYNKGIPIFKNNFYYF